MKTLRVVLIVVAVIAAISVVTYLNRSRESQGELVSKVKRSAQPVRTQLVAPCTLDETVTHTGTLAAVRDVTLSAEVSGKVLRKVKDLGDRCRRGEVLLQLDRESYRIALLQAEAALRQARAQVEQARREHQRSTALAKRSAVSSQTVERAQTAVHTGSAGVKQAEAAVQLARRNLRETTIRCPFGGTMADTMVELGQTVGPQTPLARVVDTSTLKLRLSVSAAELGRLKVGMTASLVDPTQPGRPFAGKVSRLGVAGDPATHTFPVEVEVPGGEGGPSPGQVVRATIKIATHEQVLAVPEEAIVAGGLFVVRKSKAHRVTVATGARVGDQVVVTNGIARGDEVVIVGAQALEDGAAVEVVARSGAKPARSGAKPARSGAKPPEKPPEKPPAASAQKPPQPQAQ
jgi:membrane fusion protein (multidrug efflux system)